MIGWTVFLLVLAFFLYYGYHLVTRRPAGAGDAEETAACHLCRKEFPLSQLVARDKEGGFINYFCGNCIAALHREWTERTAGRSAN